MKQVAIAKKFGLSLIWLPFIHMKWNRKKIYKNFDWQLGGFSIENLTHPLKSENFMTSTIGMWGFNPEARSWNVGAVRSDLHLDKCICSTLSEVDETLKLTATPYFRAEPND